MIAITALVLLVFLAVQRKSRFAAFVLGAFTYSVVLLFT